MTVHKIYTIDGKEYHARNNFRSLGIRPSRQYRIYCLPGDRIEWIGEVTRWGKRYRVVGWDSVVPVAEHCRSLKDAVTALVLELERREARRKATKVSWGDVIVPRVEKWVLRNDKIVYLVYDAGRPEGQAVGEVTEIAPGQWKAELTQLPLAEWSGSPISISESLAAGVHDIVDVIAKGIRPPYQLGDEASGVADDEEKEERPEHAVTCPLFDTPGHHADCAVCGGRGWVDQDQVETHLGANRVPCVRCEGEGGVESGGPVTWTCETCLGTGVMPVSLLEQFDLRDSTFDSQDWSDADLSDQNLSGVRFYDCNFSDVSFDGADLSNTSFQFCQFRGANPERAASLAGTEVLFAERSEELSEAQLAECVARGAIVTFD